MAATVTSGTQDIAYINHLFADYYILVSTYMYFEELNQFQASKMRLDVIFTL